MILRIFVCKFSCFQKGVIKLRTLPRLCVNSLQISILLYIVNECLLQDPTLVYALSGYDNLYSCTGYPWSGEKGLKRSYVKTSFVCIFLHGKQSFAMYYFIIFIHMLCAICAVSFRLYSTPLSYLHRAKKYLKLVLCSTIQ
jgi:hypothetical protein